MIGCFLRRARRAMSITCNELVCACLRMVSASLPVWLISKNRDNAVGRLDRVMTHDAWHWGVGVVFGARCPSLQDHERRDHAYDRAHGLLKHDDLQCPAEEERGGWGGAEASGEGGSGSGRLVVTYERDGRETQNVLSSRLSRSRGEQIPADGRLWSGGRMGGRG